LTTLISKN